MSKSIIELSIVLPSIRTQNWLNLCNSIKQSYNNTFEIIFIGPSCDPQVKSLPYVRYIKDQGSPMRCSQIGALSAMGKYITWAADDCVFLPGTIDNVMFMLRDKPRNTVITGRYKEGKHPREWEIQLANDYQRINHSYPKSPYIDDTWLIFNVGFMYTEYFIELGGWDCQFEACPIGHTDLAVRAQRDKCHVILTSYPVLHCEHMPARTGDHAPVHDAHMEHDEPLYKSIYNNPNCVNRVKIDPNNWISAPAVWKRRFR